MNGKLVNSLIAGTMLGLGSAINARELPKCPESSPIVSTKLPTKDDPIDIKNMDAKTYELARVIYAEAGSNSDKDTLKLICQCIKNRIDNKAFKNKNGISKNPWDVIADKKQFDTYQNENCASWNEFDPLLNDIARQASVYASLMVRGCWYFLDNINEDYKDVVYFHNDKISEAPASWSKYYKIEEVVKSNGLTFYKIE